MAELAVIARGWQRYKAQGELMRVVGARIEDGNIVNVGKGAGSTAMLMGQQGKGAGGRGGISILPHRFNPGVSLSQVRPPVMVPLFRSLRCFNFLCLMFLRFNCPCFYPLAIPCSRFSHVFSMPHHPLSTPYPSKEI